MLHVYVVSVPVVVAVDIASVLFAGCYYVCMLFLVGAWVAGRCVGGKVVSIRPLSLVLQVWLGLLGLDMVG